MTSLEPTRAVHFTEISDGDAHRIVGCPLMPRPPAQMKPALPSFVPSRPLSRDSRPYGGSKVSYVLLPHFFKLHNQDVVECLS
jgi:hypothetical protein